MKTTLPLWAALALAACATPYGGGRTRLHLIDLASGRATPIGRIGDGGHALWGLAIEP